MRSRAVCGGGAGMWKGQLAFTEQTPCVSQQQAVLEMGWKDEQRESAHKNRGNEGKKEREASNNVWLEAVEVQQVTGERWRVRQKGEAHVVEVEAVWCIE